MRHAQREDARRTPPHNEACPTTEVLTPHGPVVPQRSGFRSRMMAPGWYRAAWMTLAGAAFCFGLVVLIRALYGDPVIEGLRS